MRLSAGQVPAGFEWAVAERALAGELVSGDRHLCAPTREGMLAAVVDGLGHGEEAARAARRAVETLAQDPDAALDELIRRCHLALRGTRGAAMTLAAITTEGEVTWAGVGNVECVLLRWGMQGAKVAAGVTLRGGVVGYQVPAIRTVRQPLLPDDRIILASDGVRSSFTSGIVWTEDPEAMAAAILETHGRATDDALVLVVRVPPPGAGAEGR